MFSKRNENIFVLKIIFVSKTLSLLFRKHFAK